MLMKYQIYILCIHNESTLFTLASFKNLKNKNNYSNEWRSNPQLSHLQAYAETVPRKSLITTKCFFFYFTAEDA